MFFWWICGGESGLPILFLHHLRTAPLKRPWCWERLKAGGEGDDKGWDGWMATLTQWTWVWVDSGCWWWTGMPGVLWFMGSQRVRHAWAPELNCTFLPLKHSVLRTRESKSVKRQWFREELCLWVIFFILQFTKDGMISVQCLAAIVFTAVQFHFPWPLYR